MRIVVCHACWTWVVPQGDHCPDCHYEIWLDDPDPTPDEFSRALGTPVSRIGVVETHHTRWPNVGQLWGTTAGLVFLPFVSPGPVGAITAAVRGPRSQRRPWGDWWKVWRGRSPTFAAPASFPRTGPDETEATALAVAFFDALGSWFIPTEQMVALWTRQRTWTLSRRVGRTLTLTMLTPVEDWQPQWQRLQEQSAAWRSLTRSSGR